MRIRHLFLSLLASVIVCTPAATNAQGSALSATTIPAAQLIQPAELSALLAAKNTTSGPLVLQVGSHVLFEEAHITGSQYAGPGSQASGLALLEKTVAPLAKDRFIVLYCGCCPWGRCPNVGPAFKRLHGLGYSNVKVLYIANNFGDDWVTKGYPTQK